MNDSSEQVMLNLVLTDEQQEALTANALNTKESRAKVKTILDGVKEKLLQTDVRKVEGEKFCIEVQDVAVVNQLDVSRLKKEQPELYKQYLTQHRRNASARLKLK